MIERVFDIVLSHRIHNVIELSHLWQIGPLGHLVHLLEARRFYFFRHRNFQVDRLAISIDWLLLSGILVWLAATIGVISVRILCVLLGLQVSPCDYTKVVSLELFGFAVDVLKLESSRPLVAQAPLDRLSSLFGIDLPSSLKIMMKQAGSLRLDRRAPLLLLSFR